MPPSARSRNCECESGDANAGLTSVAHDVSMTATRFFSFLALTALAAACGGSDGGSDTVDLADTLASAKVCNGEANENAPEGGDSLGYAYLNAGDGWTSGWFDMFGDAGAIVGDEAHNILCATVTESSEAERCDYDEDGETFTLIMMDATYSLELRFAKSANVIARDTGTAAAAECPSFVSWTEGEGERRQFSQPTEALDRMLQPFFG